MSISRWKIMACALGLSVGGLAVVAGPLNNRLNAQFEQTARPTPQTTPAPPTAPAPAIRAVAPAAPETEPPAPLGLSEKDMEYFLKGMPVQAVAGQNVYVPDAVVPPQPIAPVIAIEVVQPQGPREGLPMPRELDFGFPTTGDIAPSRAVPPSPPVIVIANDPPQRPIEQPGVLPVQYVPAPMAPAPLDFRPAPGVPPTSAPVVAEQLPPPVMPLPITPYPESPVPTAPVEPTIDRIKNREMWTVPTAPPAPVPAVPQTGTPMALPAAPVVSQPQFATPQAVVPAVVTSGAKLKMLLRLGDGKPRFEIRDQQSTELLFKVYGQKIEMQSAPEGVKNSAIAGVTAVGQVRFIGPGIEGTCDQLSVLSGTGEVLLKGNVNLRTKTSKNWSEMTAEKMIYQIGANGLSTASTSSSVRPASYGGRD